MTSGRAAPAWVERYEELRAHATGHAPLDVIPRGLALLQHRGMVAWMTAPGASADAALGGTRPPRDRTEALDARRRALVRLLADVAFPLALRRAP